MSSSTRKYPCELKAGNFKISTSRPIVTESDFYELAKELMAAETGRKSFSIHADRNAEVLAIIQKHYKNALFKHDIKLRQLGEYLLRLECSKALITTYNIKSKDPNDMISVTLIDKKILDNRNKIFERREIIEKRSQGKKIEQTSEMKSRSSEFDKDRPVYKDRPPKHLEERKRLKVNPPVRNSLFSFTGKQVVESTSGERKDEKAISITHKKSLSN